MMFVLIVFTAAGCSSSGPEPAPDGGGEPPVTAPVADVDEDLSFDIDDGNKLVVYLFFQADDALLLIPEEGEIFRTESLADQAKQVLEMLSRGPNGTDLLPTIPPGTRLRELFFADEDMIVVDFSGELSASHPGGSWAELATIYSVVNSLTFNFPSVRRVKILVDGNEIETLAGHVSMDRPFRLDLSLVGRPDVVPGEEPAPNSTTGSGAEIPDDAQQTTTTGEP